MVFEVHYTLKEPVDSHPRGPRIWSLPARNHIAATDHVRLSFGPKHVGAIQVDGVSTRSEDGERLWHYLRPGCAWGGRRV